MGSGSCVQCESEERRGERGEGIWGACGKVRLCEYECGVSIVVLGGTDRGPRTVSDSVVCILSSEVECSRLSRVEVRDDVSRARGTSDNCTRGASVMLRDT